MHNSERHVSVPTNVLYLTTNILYLIYKTMNDYLDITELATVELLHQTVQRSNVVGYNGVVALEQGLPNSFDWK